MAGRSFVADRVASLGSSGIRRVFDLGATLKNPINFSIGQPDYPVPPNVKQAIVRAIEENRNGYTVTRGIAELRDKLRGNLAVEFDWQPDVLVTSGLSGGLYLALMSCLNPGDEVLIGDPYFVSYPHLVRLAGGVPVTVSLYDDFQLRAERFEKAITNKTKLVILCSPANPTGLVSRESDVAAVAALARQRDLLIVSDEIYCALSYDGVATSPAKFAPERTLVLRGFGKSHAMTGLRIAYAAGPEDIVGTMAKLQQYTYVCAPHPVQYGALEALKTDMSAQRDAYRAKRDLVCGELEGAFEFIRPSGGFYVFPKAPAHYPSASAFVDEAIRRNVLIIPGETFSGRDTHFRISYAVSDSTIRAGCEILRAMVK